MDEIENNCVRLDSPIVELKQTVVTIQESAEIRWTVRNYRRIERGKTYFQISEGRNEPTKWISLLQLKKLNKSLYLEFHSLWSTADTEFYIEYGEGRESRRLEADEFEWRRYKVSFGLDVVEASQNTYLKEKGWVQITCRQQTRCRKFVPCIPMEAPGSRTKEDEEAFLKNTSYMADYMTNHWVRNAPSTGCADKAIFKACPALLAVRTRLSAGEIKKVNGSEEEGSLYVKGNTDDLISLMTYLYTGLSEEWDFDTLKRMYGMAKFLKISSLEQRCIRNGVNFQAAKEVAGTSVA